ncbi:MAG: type IX secretion system sortase PorU [Candidatus Cloacimonetes bacterium]|nr:type IX secretion system sortase PorU [Candidatus Cloacimonadota bacterium]
MKRLFLLLIALCWLPLLFAGVRLLESSEGNLTVEYLADSYQLLDSGDFETLQMPEANYSGTVSAPSLPYLEFKIGIPVGAKVEYHILSTTQVNLPLQKRLAPEPVVSSVDGRSQYHFTIDEALYREQPLPLLQYMGESSYRSYAYVSFKLNPAQYDGNISLNLYTSALIQIKISGNLKQKSAPATDFLSRLMLDTFLNTEDAQYWQQQSRSHVHYADFSRSPWWIKLETDKKGMYRINPSQLSSLPISEIDPRSFRLFTTTGKPQPVNPSFAGNEFKEVPIYVAGEADGSFDSGDYIVFYGGNRMGWEQNASIAFQNSLIYHDIIYHNPYSENYVYWLTFAGSFDNPPLRIQENNSYATFQNTVNYHREYVHLETESHRRDRTGLIWYMTRMFGSNTQEYSFDIDLPDLVVDDDNRLLFRIIQEDTSYEQYHYISVYVNGVVLPSSESEERHRWYSITNLYFSKTSSAFRAGQNNIKIKVWRSGHPENLFLDYIRVEYKKALHKGNSQYAVNGGRPVAQKYHFSGDPTNAKVYKVNSDYDVEFLPISPETDGFSFIGSADADNSYYVSKANDLYSPVSIKKLEPTDIATVNSPVQSLIITPPLFLDKANELADFYRTDLGLSTKVVLLDDIFTQFTGGHPDPVAIRQYIKHLYNHAPAPKIQSLSLIGLGTLDWRNYSRLATPKNHIPLYFCTESDLGLFSDDYYGMLSSLFHPDIAIGRYPVSNVNELSTMIQNLKRYVQNPLPGMWRNSMLSLADDYINGNTTYEFLHTRYLEELSQLLSPALLHEKIFGEEWEYDQFLNKPKVRDEMFRHINLGKLIWYYVGHGAFDSLGQENYYTGSLDMDRFQNPDMMPLFIAATCSASAYDHWAYQSLGEKSVLLNNRGAIASVSATTDSYGGPNQSLMKHFLRNIVNNYLPIGAALTLAKTRFHGEKNNDTYCILGDPNLYVIPPQRFPSINLQNYAASDTLHSRDIVRMQGDYAPELISGEATQSVYDAGSSRYVREERVTKQGNIIFKGKVSVDDGAAFESGFILPDDLSSGADGMILTYLWDEPNKEDYLAYYHPMPLSDSVLPDSAVNDGPPQITIYLGTYDFRAGDTVSSSPTLLVKISDANGINLRGKMGHNILMVLDNSLQPVSLTDYFEYDTDSYTSGTLIYLLKNLSEGAHTLQIIAFDNYNLPAVASTHFTSSKSTSLSIENFLIYPNPMRKDGYFSFIISEAAEIILDIFSPSGKRIRRIKEQVKPGFHAVAFDSKDAFGKSLANNTYFIRLKAKSASGKSLEKREKMVIYK